MSEIYEFFIKSLTVGGVGIWVLVFGLLRLMVKTGPLITKLKNERETGALAARAEDMEKMNKRIGELEAKVETASNAAHTAEMKLVYAVSAIQLLAAKIRAIEPNDPSLAQAMELLKAATSGQMSPWSAKVAEGLSQIKATDL